MFVIGPWRNFDNLTIYGPLKKAVFSPSGASSGSADVAQSNTPAVPLTVQELMTPVTPLLSAKAWSSKPGFWIGRYSAQTGRWKLNIVRTITSLNFETGIELRFIAVSPLLSEGVIYLPDGLLHHQYLLRKRTVADVSIEFKLRILNSTFSIPEMLKVNSNESLPNLTFRTPSVTL